MNVHQTKIEWATHTWNPVTGCRHGCDYCYARRFIGRFEPKATERPVNPETIVADAEAPGCCRLVGTTKMIDAGGRERVCPYPVGFTPALYAYKMGQPAKRLTPSRIFVSSMGDLFGDWVPDSWIIAVFMACLGAPQHDYLFLTKNPARYWKMAEASVLPKEKNFYYGSTVTTMEDPFFYAEGYKTFISIEPLLGEFTEKKMGHVLGYIDWAIIGAMTGPGAKNHQPRREWVQAIVNNCEDCNVPVFMKDSLAPIWGDDLLREHPAGMLWPEDGRAGP